MHEILKRYVIMYMYGREYVENEQNWNGKTALEFNYENRSLQFLP